MQVSDDSGPPDLFRRSSQHNVCLTVNRSVMLWCNVHPSNSALLATVQSVYVERPLLMYA